MKPQQGKQQEEENGERPGEGVNIDFQTISKKEKKKQDKCFQCSRKLPYR